MFIRNRKRKNSKFVHKILKMEHNIERLQKHCHQLQDQVEALLNNHDQLEKSLDKLNNENTKINRIEKHKKDTNIKKFVYFAEGYSIPVLYPFTVFIIFLFPPIILFGILNFFCSNIIENSPSWTIFLLFALTGIILFVFLRHVWKTIGDVYWNYLIKFIKFIMSSIVFLLIGGIIAIHEFGISIDPILLTMMRFWSAESIIFTIVFECFELRPIWLEYKQKLKENWEIESNK